MEEGSFRLLSYASARNCEISFGGCCHSIPEEIDLALT
jgi:hypothetical protein